MSATSLDTAPATGGLTRHDPFLRRFAAWAIDRFPPAVCVLFVVLFGTSAFVGQVAAGGRPTLSPGLAAGALAFVAFYFGVRVYDEHKDLDVDARLHPDRLTVTGVLPLGDLRRVHAAGLAVQALVCVVADGGIGPVVLTWLAATAWTLLMLEEFFVPGWLSPRPVLYALSHQIVVPLSVVWAATLGAGTVAVGAAVGWWCLAAAAGALTFEIARKMWAPEDERPGEDSYTAVLGTVAAARLALGVMAGGAVGLVALAVTLTGRLSAAVLVAVGVLLVVTGSPLVRFARAPRPERAAALRPAAALYVLATNLIALAVLVTAEGLPWA
jgi:hypothetical protein